MILAIINYTGKSDIFVAYVRKSDYMYNESFARLVILYAALVTSLHSCIVHPCHNSAALSTPAFSTPPFLTVPLCPLPQIPSTLTLVDSFTDLSTHDSISRTLNVVRTFLRSKSVWRQYSNRCTHTAVKHMTRVTWSHSARFGRFRMNESSVSRPTGVTSYRGNQKQTTATYVGCGNMRLPHWPLPDESTVFRPEDD